MKSWTENPSFIVWVVAIAGSIETALQAIAAAFARHTTDFLVWSAGTFLVVGAAAFVESLKGARGG